MRGAGVSPALVVHLFNPCLFPCKSRCDSCSLIHLGLWPYLTVQWCPIYPPVSVPHHSSDFFFYLKWKKMHKRSLSRSIFCHFRGIIYHTTLMSCFSTLSFFVPLTMWHEKLLIFQAFILMFVNEILCYQYWFPFNAYYVFVCERKAFNIFDISVKTLVQHWFEWLKNSMYLSWQEYDLSP